MKLVRFGLFLVTLCLLLCSRAEAVAPQPQEFHRGSNIMRLGDPLDDVLKFLGRPILIAADGENYCWRDRIDLYSPELIVKATKGKKKIFAVVVDKLPGITTPEGIGIGATREQVEEQYGKVPHEYIDHNRDVVLCYGGGTAKKKGRIVQKPYFRLRLDPKTKKVRYMVIGKPPGNPMR